MLIVSGKITVTSGKRDEFVSASREAIVKARKARGCRHFVVAADPVEADIVNVYEEWDGEDELLAFRKSGPSADMRAMIISADVKRHEILRSGPA